MKLINIGSVTYFKYKKQNKSRYSYVKMISENNVPFFVLKKNKYLLIDLIIIT